MNKELDLILTSKVGRRMLLRQLPKGITHDVTELEKQFNEWLNERATVRLELEDNKLFFTRV